MPRKAKEKIEEIPNKIEKTELTSKKTTTKKASSSTKKTVVKKQIEPTKIEKTSSKSTTKTTKKKTSTTKKASTTKASSTQKGTKSKNSASTSQTKKRSTAKIRTRKTPTKKKVEILEYYDLPYRYHQTVVKILAQTPTTLFVYWDISDEDRRQYMEQYGEYFFHNTKPVLIIHNKTKHYSFEIDINDFANSWYLTISDSKCDYEIELGRRPINDYVQLSNNYMYVTTSNAIESPNDHILFDRLSHFVYFRNVKTNQTTQKSIANLSFLRKIGKIRSIQEFYQKLYPEEALHFDRLDLKNPSSGNPSSSFK